MKEFLLQPNVVTTAMIILASWPLGLLARWFVARRLVTWATHTDSRIDDVVLTSLRRPIVMWSMLAGLHFSLRFAPISIAVSAPLQKLVIVGLIISVTLWLSDLVARLLELMPTGRDSQTLPITGVVQNVARGVVLVTGAIVLLGTMGVSITPIITTLGVGGLAVALALQETLSNIFAGIHITIAKNIRVGDFVRLESGDEGEIEDIGWRTTRIRMLPNNVVLIPNSRLAQSIVTNYELPTRDLAVLVDVGVHYSSDLAHVERVTCEVGREVMKTVDGAVPDFEPFVRYKAFNESSIDFTVILRGREVVARYLIKHEFIKQLHHRYATEGIVIPYPIHALNLSQEQDDAGKHSIGGKAWRFTGNASPPQDEEARH